MDTQSTEQHIGLARARHRTAQKAGVQFTGLRVRIKTAETHDRRYLDGIPGPQIAQFAEWDRHFDVVRILLGWISVIFEPMHLGRAIKLLDPDSGHIREA